MHRSIGVDTTDNARLHEPSENVGFPVRPVIDRGGNFIAVSRSRKPGNERDSKHRRGCNSALMLFKVKVEFCMESLLREKDKCEARSPANDWFGKHDPLNDPA